ncbi:Gfo/Idh/MocA family protein [Hoeflea sp. TYP-13]|uniref:Gfo/Idh/MocA family protein n=1 Tax=Hoeflea sp. TYP-13 TaxID=3230023 RepID=UPI0034C5B445
MTGTLLPEMLFFDGPFPRISRRLRLGIVGGGRISGMQATAARLTDRWDVVAGALSSDPGQAKARGAERYLPQDRCYASFEEMAIAEAARPDGVDAVMITTPNHLHHAAAKAFLNAGIDVLCDKPLTNEMSEAKELVLLAGETGRVFGVSYTMSCFPMIRQAREIVADGQIGRINQIHVEFMQDWMIPDSVADAPHVKWRLDPSKSGRTSCTGDIGTHAAHLASFVSGLAMTHLRAEMHVCGAPKPLEDTVFMMTRYEGDVPGTLMATRLAPGNRGGLRLRVFGSEGGLEWDLEKSEVLKFNRFGEADRIISRGHGHGVSARTERLVQTARGFPEGIIEAWANLYTEFALAVAARRDGLSVPDDWLGMPRVADGARGVRFIEATVRSHNGGGAWVAV